jgi:hypothetical protein
VLELDLNLTAEQALDECRGEASSSGASANSPDAQAATIGTFGFPVAVGLSS